MKKRILFIMPGLGAGGGEKSLITLLNEWDYTRYDVDLFLLNKEGLFIPNLPPQVNLLETSQDLQTFNKFVAASVREFLIRGKLKLAWARLMFCVVNRLSSGTSEAEQKTWKYLKKAIGVLPGEYDVAIGYLEKTADYICADCINAKKKIGWIHNDYRKLKLNPRVDSRYLEKMNYIVTVSEECRKVLKEVFPALSPRIRLIHNIISAKTIRKLADISLQHPVWEKGKINLLSVGRLDQQKGFDIGIEACSLLIQKGYQVNWCVIGEGTEREKLEKLIKEKNLENAFRLLGLRNNPYQYIKTCDIYVQPSRFEGKSIAIDEARILARPIVVTNFSTVKDQIQDQINGLVARMDPVSLADTIMKLADDANLREKLTTHLRQSAVGNEEEIYKLYSLLG